jgi:hypothetical protein
MANSNSSAKPGNRIRESPRAETVERRSSDRVSLSMAAELFEMPAGARIAGRVSDCCMFGCFVDTIHTFPDRTPIRLRLHKGKELFEAEAVVAYSQLRLGMGIAFTYVSQENKRLLESWLSNGSDHPIHGMAPVVPEPELRPLTSQSEQFEKLVHLLVVKGILKEAEARELLAEYVF